ncbi:MAG: PD40 domain-containing protein [Chitinophagaceae bacterium]|nr:PD40 domain-containing protein [Chitinophagaceae bacterium]
MNSLSRTASCIFALLVPLTIQITIHAQVVATPYFSDPALSPDATEIAFVSGGDIWTVPAAGGEARLLVSHADYDSRPLYSPDGLSVAFSSTRSGNGDVYVLTLASGQLKRLTYDDAPDELSAWSRDGKYVYFSSSSRDISAMRDVFRVAVRGGTPMSVSGNRYVNEFFAMPSPDGKTLAMTARGVASHQWWRNGRSHLDESEIWLMKDENGSYEKITDRGARQLWPMWSPDGKSIYYVSDQTGAQNLYVLPIGGTSKKLTQFDKGRVVWPTISNNGKAIVFERDFKVWYYDIASGKTSPVSIARKGSPAGPGVEHVRLNNQFRDLALSPDGKKAAFTARGEVFVANAKDGGDAMRVTQTTGMESQVTWASNSNILVYVSDRDGASHLYQYNFTNQTETRLTNTNADDASPRFSSNGKLLAFVRNAQELRVLDMTTKNETLITKGYFGFPAFPSQGSYTWSPDNKWLAYAGFGTKTFRNIYVVSASGGESKPVSFLANVFSEGVSWSKDGKYILFNTSQRTENGVVARVDLVPQRPKFREEQFQQMFVDPTSPAPDRQDQRVTPPSNQSVADTSNKAFMKKNESATIVWEGLQQRLSLLPGGVDVDEHIISPDGNTLVMIANVGNQSNIYSYTLDELSREPAVLKQITSTIAFKSSLQFSPDSKEVFFLEQGRIQSVVLDSRVVKPLAIVAEMDIDFNKEKTEVFKLAWDLQQSNFYDPGFHGADWGKVKQTYAPLVEGAGTVDELRRILGMMVGELNASHSGVSGPALNFIVGRIGLRYERNEFEKNGRLKVSEVVAQGPAAISGIQAGDYILAVDGVTITVETNIDQLLENRINRMVTLTVASALSDKNGKKVSVRPVNNPIEKGLMYRQWVKQQRDYVEKASGGKLGYVHMFDMGQESLNQLYVDLDAENHAREGVVIDIRNNNGGFVNAYALDVLSRKGYMTMTIRGLPAAPARLQLGQRALDAPTILVTNQHSLSDAEDFSEGYRRMKLGKIVGEPTSGWIIYTSNVGLFDGTVVRLPFIKITDNDGKNMELAPRPVDIPVSNPLGEKDKDSQLDVAVRELLKEVGGKK